MYDAVEEIVLAVIADKPNGDMEQAVMGYNNGRFRPEEKHPQQDVETRE